MLPKTIIFNVSHIIRRWEHFSPCVPIIVPAQFCNSFFGTDRWKFALEQFTGHLESPRDDDPFKIHAPDFIAIRRMLRSLWPTAPSLLPNELHAALLIDVCLTLRGRRSCGWLVRDDGVVFYELGDPAHSVFLP